MGVSMKKFLIAGIAAAAFVSAPALAADYPVKAPMVQAYDWSGLYVGINGGWDRTHVNWAFDPAIPAAANQSFSFNKDGSIYGVHVGLQKQFGMWVFGAEAAYDVLSRNYMTGPDYGNNAAQGAQARITNNLFTVGPRIGFAPSNKLLLFATGGYAGKIDIETRSVTRATGIEAAAQHAKTGHDGWYVGGGAEYAFMPNIIFGVEYQYLKFSSTLQCPPAFGSCATGAAVFADRDVNGNVNIVRARLSYLFQTR
jgi:outer membrane immunogenic protein